MARLLIGNECDEDLVGSLRVRSADWTSQFIVWYARDGDIIVLPNTPDERFLEYATGLRSLALHRRAFEPTAPFVPDRVCTATVGKAVYYARQQVVVPSGGPWEDVLRRPPLLVEAPPFADIPTAGQRIAAGRPILTIFSTSATISECELGLRQTAREMDEWFLKRTMGRR